MADSLLIDIDPDICFGKPHIRGTRLKVSFILDLLGSGWTIDDVLHEYDHITREAVLACLSYAGTILENYRAKPGVKDAT